MKMYLVTFLYGIYGELMCGYVIYFADCFGNVRTQFRSEYDSDEYFIKQIDILEIM